MIHVVPVDDEREHEETTSCWCVPRLILGEPELIIVHQAADCRELIEKAMEISRSWFLRSIPQGQDWGPFESEHSAWHHLFGKTPSDEELTSHKRAGWSVFEAP